MKDFIHKHTLRIGIVLLAIGAALIGFSVGRASANAYGADADCAGLHFSMPRGEAETVITVRLDGQVVRTLTVQNQNDATAFDIASPSRTVAHSWSVFIDSKWNQDQTFTETVPACETPSTTTSSTVAPTTTLPSTTTTQPSTTTSAPAASTTIVTTPRPAPTSAAAPITALPETGGPWANVAIVAAGAIVIGVAILAARRMSSRYIP